MTGITFEQRIIDYLCTNLQLKYNSRLKYINEDTKYVLEWMMNDQDHPYVMMGDFESEDQFFDYVVKEIHRSRFYLKQHFVAIMDTTNTTL